jgi:predicted transcriptional regulator of viral defense system
MNYADFRSHVDNFPYILSKEAVKLYKDHQVMKNQLSRWEKKGLVVKLRQGMYVLNDQDRKIMPTRTFLANQMYEPSYVSLEYALGLHDLIPERVETVTSVTTRKTACFKNKFGDFTYQHVKPQSFGGFSLHKDEENLRSFVADPEKAVVDFLYFHSKECKTGHVIGLLIGSYRFQNMETLRWGKVLSYARLFSNEKLQRTAAELCEHLKGGSVHA